MILSFSKYHGTGNDFVMVDCTKTPTFDLTKEQIEKICHRRFGVGADGVILLYKQEKLDFKMVYYNSDGTQSFCGNGARCATLFAYDIGLIQEKADFEAIDGFHSATVHNREISLKMNDVLQDKIQIEDKVFIIDTGSPHYIKFSSELEKEDIVSYGKSIRYSDRFQEKGINVNLAEIIKENELKMATYERGVEDETYSCGTGATAVAIAYGILHEIEDIHLKLNVKGGVLSVKAKQENKEFSDVYLIGPATKVFEGEMEI